MHPEISSFVNVVKIAHPEYFKGKKVLEVGSLDINGTIRGHFEKASYIGLDLGPGKGVDIVSPIHQYEPGHQFDIVISTEMLEHDIHWQESLRKMYDLLEPNGLLVLTCAGPARQEHGTKRTTPGDSPFTTDYYRNISLEDFSSVLGKELFDSYSLDLYRGDTDLYFFGIKR